MGYTHYWKQTRWIEVPEWRRIQDEIRLILQRAADELGVEIGDGRGAEGSEPIYEDDCILFNGIGRDGYEGFYVERRTKRLAPPSDNWTDFCKTGEKPYDPVVTACLCYLSTATRVVGPDGFGVLGTEALHVTSDGRGKDFVAGLNIARGALPQLGERLDLPLGVMAKDRGTSPFIYPKCKEYKVLFCTDGHGYVLNNGTDESAYFESHAKLASFLADHARITFRRAHPEGEYGRVEANIWEPSGLFDRYRVERITRAQRSALSKLFPPNLSNARRPPAFIRPEECPHSNRLIDLFDLVPDHPNREGDILI
jgi:hypothetical protein